ncbi:MAG: YlbF family regulator [Anaerovoracaceae bacterium]
MNVYEEAHKLQRAIKESDEYIRYMAAKDKLSEKPEIKSMMDDFQKKQLDLQTRQMLGQETSADMLAEVSKLSAIVMQDPLAAEYLQCQMRFSIMVKDVYDILNEVIGLTL